MQKKMDSISMPLFVADYYPLFDCQTADFDS